MQHYDCVPPHIYNIPVWAMASCKTKTSLGLHAWEAGEVSVDDTAGWACSEGGTLFAASVGTVHTVCTCVHVAACLRLLASGASHACVWCTCSMLHDV